MQHLPCAPSVGTFCPQQLLGHIAQADSHSFDYLPNMQKLTICTGASSRLHNKSINGPLASLLDVSFLPEPTEH